MRRLSSGDCKEWLSQQNIERGILHHLYLDVELDVSKLQ